MEEKVKWIPGYRDKYVAARDGRIFRVLKDGKIKKLNGYVRRNNYLIKLAKNGEYKEYFFNRIIWETFSGEIPDGYVVIRKKSVLTENGLDNLMLKSTSQHGKETGSMSRSKAVELLNDNGKVIDSWSSARKAAVDLFVSYQTVTDICNKKVKKKPIVNVRWKIDKK